MLEKKLVFIGLLCTLATCSSSLVYAQEVQAKESDGCDLEVIGATEFKTVIENILTLKSEYPEYTDEIILHIMNAQHSEEQKRGIIDIWNVLTDSEKRLCIRYPFDVLKVNEAKNIATSQTEVKFGFNGLGDRSDEIGRAACRERG